MRENNPKNNRNTLCANSTIADTGTRTGSSMKISMMALAVMVGGLGCSLQDETADPANLSFATESLSSCGLGCGPGYHATAFRCDGSCPGWIDCGIMYNATTCELNVGSFWNCGYGCPRGWLSQGTGTNFACAGSITGQNFTQTFCVSACGNGTCEPFQGEDGTSCPQDCCDATTPCNVTYRNQGTKWCRSMSPNGSAGPGATWFAWQWYDDSTSASGYNQFCDQSGELCVSHARCATSTANPVESVCKYLPSAPHWGILPTSCP
jgi:hypothetical protein